MALRRLLDHRFLRDTATLQLGALFNAAGNFISAVLLAHLLGAKLQGQFYVAVSLYSLLWFLVNQGLVQATVSQVAAANSRGQRDKAAGWLAWLWKASIVWGIGICALGFLLLPSVADWWFDGDRRIGVWAAWLSLSPLLELPRVVACAGMQGMRRMVPLALTENGQEAIRVFLVVTGALITRSATGPVIGTVVASALGSVVALELFRRDRLSAASPLPALREIAAHLREVPLHYGTPLGVKVGLVRNLNALCMEILPSLILKYFGSDEWVAYVRIAQRLMKVPLMFMQGISRTTLPMFSEIAGLRDIARLRHAFFKVTLYSGLIISAGVLVFLAVLPWVLSFAFPPEYREPLWTVCLILVPGFLIMSFSIANDTFYLVTNTLRVAVVISVMGTLASILLLIWLAYRNPTTGVPWGLSLAMASSGVHFAYAAWYLTRHRTEPVAKPLEEPIIEAPVEEQPSEP